MNNNACSQSFYQSFACNFRIIFFPAIDVSKLISKQVGSVPRFFSSTYFKANDPGGSPLLRDGFHLFHDLWLIGDRHTCKMRRGTSFANSRTISALSKVTLETFINSESFLRIHLGIKHCYNYSRSLKIHHVICRILWLYFLFDTSSLAPYIPKISRCSHCCGPILISKQKNKVTTPPQKKLT